MIEKKLEMLEKNTEKKDIRNDSERRRETRNKKTKSRKVGQRRWNGQSTRSIQWIVKPLG